MKDINRYFFVVSLLVVLFIVSCKDVLDITPDGRLTPQDVFKTNDMVAAKLATCYSNIPAKGYRYFFYIPYPVIASDEAWDSDYTDGVGVYNIAQLYDGAVSAANNYLEIADLNIDCYKSSDFWRRYWVSIRDCNEFLANIDKAVVNNERDRQRWRAEAHILRAWYYTELLKWYGPVPIMKNILGASDSYKDLRKASFYEVVKYIISDCNFALKVSDDLLPWFITSGAPATANIGESGRVTKALAVALKSQMILFAASPLNAFDKDGKKQDYWKEAAQIQDSCISTLESKGYKLATDGTDIFKVFASQINNDNNGKFNVNAGRNGAAALKSMFTTSYPENLPFGSRRETEVIYQSNAWNMHLWWGNFFLDNYKAGACPTQEHVDAYETIDGQPVLDPYKPYLDEQHTQPNYNPKNKLYDPNNPYVNRDPRFYTNVYYNGCSRTCKWTQDAAGRETRTFYTIEGDQVSGLNAKGRKYTKTGYYMNKFLHPNSGYGEFPAPGAIIYRLAEIYLNAAECYVEVGDLEKARLLVKKIRDRVGMPTEDSWTDQLYARWRVRHERRIELAMEEHRYFDVRRWQNPNGDLKETDQWLTAMVIKDIDPSKPHTKYTYTRRPIVPNPRACWTNKYLRQPIPQNEAVNLEVVTGVKWQNTGW